MSGSQIIVEKLNYPPLQIIVTGNDGPGSLPPVSVLVYELVGICPLLDQWLSTVVDLVSHYSVVDRLVISDVVFISGKSLPFFWVVGVCPFSSSQVRMYIGCKEAFRVYHKLLVIFIAFVIVWARHWHGFGYPVRDTGTGLHGRGYGSMPSVPATRSQPITIIYCT